MKAKARIINLIDHISALFDAKPMGSRGLFPSRSIPLLPDHGALAVALDQAKRQLPVLGFVAREKALEARRDLAHLELAAPTEFLSDVS
jgi:hypothetical protein